MKTLSAHMSQMMADGRITDGRIYGVQHNKKKAKRTGMQGMPGSQTGSGSNKPMMGKDAPGESRTDQEDVNNGALLKTKKPKVKKPNLVAPKKVSAFVKAFQAAKNSIHVSTNSKAVASGAKPTKGSTAKTKGAGVD